MSAAPTTPELPASARPVPLPYDGPLRAPLSVFMWLINLCWLIPMMSLMMLVSLVLPPWRTDWLNRLYCWGQLRLCCRWRAELHPDIDPDAVYLFAQNHTNHFDHVVLYNASPHFKQGLELEDHFKIPFYGWFMRSRGTIPVRRGRQGQAEDIMATMRQEVARGHSILAFPEGTRSKNGRVGAFRRGTFYIARDLGIPVVPVAVTGMYEVMRKGSWHIRPGYTVTVHCLQPIPTAGLSNGEVAELARECRRRVAEKVDAYWSERQPGGDP